MLKSHSFLLYSYMYLHNLLVIKFPNENNAGSIKKNSFINVIVMKIKICLIIHVKNLGGQNKAIWEDVTGSTPLTFVKDCVSFTTTVSARFWLMDCRNVSDSAKMATELYTQVNENYFCIYKSYFHVRFFR